MNKKFFMIALSGLFLAACGGEVATGDATDDTADEVVEVCTYAYDPAETVLTWTAFKLTERVGVDGTFDEINVTANDGASTLFEVLTGATFDIPVSSLNSQDEVRDPKIKNSFFGIMNETANITGVVSTLSENGGSVEITMNGISKTYDGEVKMDGEQVTFLTQIDLVDFDGQEAVDSLGVVCEAKHTGEDGVNKLWTEVDIAVKTTLVKECK
ncbi:MAG: hypothetical protein GQ574_15640 [Crocinitomix sp.]|nr:hypothetical protein [Crocinitomix sp.]